ncbi:hypothetical protein C8R43DRAFT_1143243 [Mycena crocata]|nr:hypothetical protein C8R43DRAFT_1143243 [Mycena crocata]
MSLSRRQNCSNASLFVLPTLEKLEISDQAATTGGGADHRLVANSLLLAFMPTFDHEAPGLVPRLRTIDDDRFVCSLGWIFGHERDLDPQVAKEIERMCAQRELNFRFKAASLRQESSQIKVALIYRRKD